MSVAFAMDRLLDHAHQTMQKKSVVKKLEEAQAHNDRSKALIGKARALDTASRTMLEQSEELLRQAGLLTQKASELTAKINEIFVVAEQEAEACKAILDDHNVQKACGVVEH